MSEAPENLKSAAENRVMSLTTPLEDELLLLSRVTAREEISELFHIRAELYSPNPAIDFDQIIGQRVSIRVDTPGGGGREFSGVVSSFCLGDMDLLDSGTGASRGTRHTEAAPVS